MNRIWNRLAVVALLSIVLTAVGAEGKITVGLNPDEFKAGILMKILPYIEWPRQKSKDEILVGVVGRYPMTEVLRKLAAGETVRGRRIRIIEFEPGMRSAEVKSLEGCHVVFIHPNEIERWKGVSAELDAKGLLTVGAFPPGQFFDEVDGIINLVVASSRMEIHRRHARNARIKISSRLSRIAKVY